MNWKSSSSITQDRQLEVTSVWGDGMNEVILEAKAIVKSFGETKALAGTDLTVFKGEIHGLIGENGSGKSTLSAVISGILRCDSGEMTLNGRPYAPRSTHEAAENGVKMILQEQGTINGISVAANIFLGEEQRFVHNALLNVPEMINEARKALEAINADHINPAASVDDVSFEDRKVVEIARAMFTNPSILCVDETTTALPRRQREILYDIMQKMRSEGKSVLFISHDIEEIMEVCDRVTIMRDGIVTGVLTKEEMEPTRLKQLMVGRTVNENYYRSDNSATREEGIALSVNGISTNVLHDITFDLYKGEILGISGLTDSGMHDLGHVLYGIDIPDRGVVKNGAGKEIHSVAEAINSGIGYISKNRDVEALMLTGSVKDNICLPALPKLVNKGFITARRERAYISEWAEKLRIKMTSSNQLVSNLSGGNKQKVSVAKWLAIDVDVFIMDCPTRGIDVGVKADMYQLMNDLKLKGKSIIMISEEMPELIGMSDRILTMRNGAISHEFSRSDGMIESKIIDYII